MDDSEQSSHREYVGHPEAFDVLGASQFSLLFVLGLRESHAVLDVGCGSLRSARLLTSYLQKGRYYGIDPNRWLIDSAIHLKIGETLLAIKEPHFAFSDDLDLMVFGESFDYIQAHSIVTHMPQAMITRLFSQISVVLNNRGIFVGTYLPATNDYSGIEWRHPEIVPHRWETLCRQAEDCALRAYRLIWPHPRQCYFALTRAAESLVSILSSRATPYSPNLPLIHNESSSELDNPQAE